MWTLSCSASSSPLEGYWTKQWPLRTAWYFGACDLKDNLASHWVSVGCGCKDLHVIRITAEWVCIHQQSTDHGTAGEGTWNASETYKQTRMNENTGAYTHTHRYETGVDMNVLCESLTRIEDLCVEHGHVLPTSCLNRKWWRAAQWQATFTDQLLTWRFNGWRDRQTTQHQQRANCCCTTPRIRPCTHRAEAMDICWNRWEQIHCCNTTGDRMTDMGSVWH